MLYVLASYSINVAYIIPDLYLNRYQMNVIIIFGVLMKHWDVPCDSVWETLGFVSLFWEISKTILGFRKFSLVALTVRGSAGPSCVIGSFKMLQCVICFLGSEIRLARETWVSPTQRAHKSRPEASVSQRARHFICKGWGRAGPAWVIYGLWPGRSVWTGALSTSPRIRQMPLLYYRKRSKLFQPSFHSSHANANSAQLISSWDFDLGAVWNF